MVAWPHNQGNNPLRGKEKKFAYGDMPTEVRNEKGRPPSVGEGAEDKKVSTV